jgi:glucose/mannose transport system substrate-binding protein
MKRLRSYIDPGSPGRNWNDTTAMVITGKAGFQIMGDWAKGEFASAKQTAGKEFGCFPGFGPTCPTSWAATCSCSRRPAMPKRSRRSSCWPPPSCSPATQVAFNNKKGSIPIRTDVDTSQMDPCAQAGMAALKDRSRHLAVPDMLMTPDMYGAVQDVISKFWNSGQSVDDAVKALQRTLKPT